MDLPRNEIIKDRLKIVARLISDSTATAVGLAASATKDSSKLEPIISNLRSAQEKLKGMGRTKARVQAVRELDKLANTAISLSDAIDELLISGHDLKEFKTELPVGAQ